MTVGGRWRGDKIFRCLLTCRWSLFLDGVLAISPSASSAALTSHHTGREYSRKFWDAHTTHL